MSHSYYAMCPTGAEVVPVDELLASAKERWPGARDVAPGALNLAQVGELDARELRFDGSALALSNAGLDAFYEVARWFGGLVPDGHELLLTEPSHGRLLQPFTESTTKDEVARVLGGQPGR